MATKWEPVVDLTRSWIDRRVWVPRVVGDTGDDCFLYAGGLRLVRLWAEEEYVKAGDRHRWTKDTRDSWTLEVAPAEV